MCCGHVVIAQPLLEGIVAAPFTVLQQLSLLSEGFVHIGTEGEFQKIDLESTVMWCNMALEFQQMLEYVVRRCVREFAHVFDSVAID